MATEINSTSFLDKTSGVKSDNVTAKEIAKTIQLTKTTSSSTMANPVLKLNNNSALNVFFNAVKDTPFCSQAITNLINILQHDPNSENILSNYLGKFKQQQLPQALQDSIAYASKNNSDFFLDIKSFYQSLYSNQDKKIVIDFIKSYQSFMAYSQINKSVYNKLSLIYKTMPEEYQNKISKIINSYYLGDNIKNISQNLADIKNDVLPVLNKYVIMTSDFGKGRYIISIMLNDLARMELATQEVLKYRIKQLLKLQGFKAYTGLSSYKEIVKIMILDKKNLKSTTSQQFINEIIKNAKNNIENNQEVSELVKSMLLMHNPYLSGVTSFLISENKNKFNVYQLNFMQDTPNELSINIIGSIEALGNFECIIALKDNFISVNLYGSMIMLNNAKKIKLSLEEIIKSNGFKVLHIKIDLLNKNETVAQIFSKINKRKVGINGEI